jgi:hypothetical protein
MPTEAPIACSLTADELPERIAAAAELGRTGLLDVQTNGPRAELRFSDDPAVQAGIDRLVEAESKCCPFFSFQQRGEQGTKLLAIEAPEDGTWAVRGVVAGIVSGWAA